MGLYVQDFDTFEANLIREINESMCRDKPPFYTDLNRFSSGPAARESLQLDRAEPERLTFDPKAHHGVYDSSQRSLEITSFSTIYDLYRDAAI